MTKIGDIELKDVVKDVSTFLLTGFAIIGLACCIVFGISIISWHLSDTLPTPTTTPAQSYPTPYLVQLLSSWGTTPTTTPAQSYPTTITYTVLSTTTSTGHFQIYTTDGKILYCMDYYDYNLHNPCDTYTATVTGMDGTAYLITTPQVIAYGSDLYDQYPQYYNYGGRYYQTDGRTVDQVTWKQAAGERVINGKPPGYYHR